MSRPASRFCDHQTPVVAGPAALPEAPLGDLRFRGLLSEDAWRALPLAVRRRFSKRLAGGQTAVYAGHIAEARFSRLGFLLAQAARLVGGPLPISRDTGVPTVVTVTEDCAHGGQIWTRLYARRNANPQVISSSKRFAGPTGLEEHLGWGLGMSLAVSVHAGALLFSSTRYFVALGRRRMTLPRWANPGALTVTHRETGEGRFDFTLDLVHPWFGPLIHQRGEFQDAIT